MTVPAWGWSERGPAPRDARQISEELHTLLANAGEAGPYVLVAHSLGGVVRPRCIAAQYTADIAGVVLVEATHPELLTRLPAELAAGFTTPEWQLSLFGILGRVGVARGINLLVPDLSDLPPAQRSAVAALNVSTRSLDTIAAELARSRHPWHRRVRRVIWRYAAAGAERRNHLRP